MTDTAHRRARITTAVVGSGVAVVIAVTAFGAARGSTAGDDPTAAPTDTVNVAAATDPASTAPASDPATSAPASTAPNPGPTVSTPIASEAPIRTDLVAEVTAMKAFTAKTTTPGEIGGPAVRFSISLKNTTGQPISLADTVVNATSGADRDPAYAIDSQSKPFPTTVPAGKTVTGVYVFTMPTDERGTVTVTLDTSTNNPVVAFTGAAPR